jgi:hypothetical protein
MTYSFSKIVEFRILVMLILVNDFFLVDLNNKQPHFLFSILPEFKKPTPIAVFCSLIARYGRSNTTFASRRLLLAVIFSSENVSDYQTGFIPRISQNISAVFSRMSDIWGVGHLPGKIVSDGEVVRVKEQVFSWFCGEFQTPPKTGLLFPFPLLQPISKTICQPIGNNKAGFPPLKTGDFGFQSRIPGIRKNVLKDAPIRPVTVSRPKSEYFRIEP